MSILTIDEIHAACPNAQSERELYDFAAGITVALEKACNRVFARRVSNATAVSGTATATIPRHGWSVGQSIRIAAINAAPHWDGITTVASVTGWDTITFEIDSEVSEETAAELSIRPVRQAVLQTNGGQTVLLHPRPVAEITSLELGNGDGTYETALAASAYAIGDPVDGVSYSGELVLYETFFPYRAGDYRGGQYITAGARVSFVCGEAIVPSDIIYGARQAMKSVWANRNKTKPNMQSESYDYYSYSRMNTEQLSEMFGELQSIIRSHRLALI